MAQTDDEKAVQGIKDPAKRKAAYYTRQRETAYAKGDNATLDKISKKRGFKSENDEFASKLKGKGMTASDAANALGGDGDALGGLVKGAGRAIKGAASKFIPKFDEAAKGASDMARKAFGKASSKTSLPKNVTPSQKALPGKSAQKALPGKSAQKAVTGSKRKALGTSGYKDYDAELASQSAKSPSLAKSVKAVAKKAAPRAASKAAGNVYADYDNELKRLQKKPRAKKAA